MSENNLPVRNARKTYKINTYYLLLITFPVVMSFSDRGLSYPPTHQGQQSDIYHGIEVRDPYRWLEDPDSEATKAWVTAQNQVTADYLSQIPSRERIKSRLTQLWNYEKYTSPFKRGETSGSRLRERYFYFKNDGLQNQDVLYSFD